MIEGFKPQSTNRPENVAELGDLIRRASAQDLALYPIGGGTMQHLGYTPAKPGLGIDMRAFDQVIDYPARDITITVQAGITIAKLQEALAKENQWLPIDVPMPETATMGGSIAVNASGPRRYGYGTLRDYVIGISFMNDEGQEVKAGGRVVKNVAGYDICKLQIGALGTLGIITQATLKVKPKPEACALMMMADIRTHELEARIEQVLRTESKPTAVDVKSSRTPDEALDAHRVTIWVLFEDSVAAVEWQKAKLIKEWQGAFVEAVSPELTVQSMGRLTNVSAATVSFRANMRPSAAAEFLRAAVTSGPPQLYSNAGSGIVYGHWLEELPMDSAAEKLTYLRKLAVRHYGNLVITRCPQEWKPHLPIWGGPRSDWGLMKKVKQAIDPKNLFNPGRFIVG